MALSKIDEMLETVAQMSVMEIVEFIEKAEKKFNVSAAPIAMAAAPAAGGATQAAEEKSEFNVMLTNFGANKVNVIKVVRELTGLGLKEAKDLVEGAPAAVKEGVAKKDAEEMKKKLEEAGATVEIK